MFDPIPRRDFLWRLGGGLGGIALAEMLGRDGLIAGTASGADIARPRPDLNGGLHHRAKVRRIIQLFMNGGVSQMDTFDHKPELDRRHGQRFDPGSHVEAPTSAPGNLMKSPFAFRRHGESGRWVSNVFPEIARCVDDLAFLLALSSKTNVHGPASYMMNCGFLMPGFPCLGAWLSYGLGSLVNNLPTFVVLPDPRGLPYNAKGNFTAGFLPQSHQGTILDAGAPKPIPDLFPPDSARFLTADSRREGLEVLAWLNRRHAAANEGDTRLESRIAAYELAARMQQSAPKRWISAARPRRCERCTDWTTPTRPTSAVDASWAGDSSSEASVSCRSGAGPAGRRRTGTTTATSPASFPRSRARSTVRSRRCCAT